MKTEKRFGTVAVESGLITKAQLLEALTVQATENIQEGRHRLLGEILVDLGYLDEEGVQQVLQKMNHAVMCALALGR